jgi:hypothetical protein
MERDSREGDWGDVEIDEFYPHAGGKKGREESKQQGDDSERNFIDAWGTNTFLVIYVQYAILSEVFSMTVSIDCVAFVCYACRRSEPFMHSSFPYS